MLRIILKNILTKFGKKYAIDENISERFILNFLANKIFSLFRGIVFLRRSIFLAEGVTVKTKGQFRFGPGCVVGRNVSIDCFGKEGVTFGSSVSIGSYSVISVTSHMSKFGKGLNVGNNTGTGEYSYFGCSGGVAIGNDVIMGQYVSFHSQNHVYDDSDNLIREQGVTEQGITLGDNIWVGSKVTFLDGCAVGSNSVVAAGAVVTKKFPPNCLLGGVPAKIIKNLNS